MQRDPTEITKAREQAESDHDDGSLLALRDLELAWRELPPIIDGTRRAGLLDVDAITTTWTGWELRGGQRVLLRCLRPRWRKDPVMLRRLAGGVRDLRGAPRSLMVPVARMDGDWPHLRLPFRGTLLTELLPTDEPADTVFMAQLLAHGLAGLAALHSQGRAHGGDIAAHLVAGHDRPRLAWLDRFDPPGNTRSDLVGLAGVIAALDPYDDDPVGQMASSWIDDPPPSAADAIGLLYKTLGSALLSSRHQLAVASRNKDRRGRAARLARLVARLEGAHPPPPVRICLRAGQDSVLVLADSDGERVIGGAAADPATRHLPRAWTRDAGLDVGTTRFLLRSWATRATGDENLRGQVQEGVGGNDIQADALMRWLSAMSRLRAARKLLRFEVR